MRMLAAVSLLMLCGGQALSAQIVFGGEVHLGLQNWTSAGGGGDSKLGIGAGGLLGIGFQVDSSNKLIIGPGLDLSAWSSSESGTTAYIEMTDIGAGALARFGNLVLTAGSGISTITAGVRANGHDTRYTYSGDQVNFYQVGIAYRLKPFLIGLSSTSYTGIGKDCGHVDIRVGFGK